MFYQHARQHSEAGHHSPGNGDRVGISVADGGDRDNGPPHAISGVLEGTGVTIGADVAVGGGVEGATLEMRMRSMDSRDACVGGGRGERKKERRGREGLI